MIKKIGNLFLKIGYKFSPQIIPAPSIQAIRCAPWFADNGDKTLRLDYDLNAESIVFDLGGYEGQWASDIFSKYVCTIYIFEPYKKYAENIKKTICKES